MMKAEYIDHMGNDDSIVNAARVSFRKQADQYTPEQNANLIRYLSTHGHWSPFAHGFVTLHMKAPIAIHAQAEKHQVGFAMNTVSRRYVSDTPDLFVPEFRTKPNGSIKQGSGGKHGANKQWQSDYEYMARQAINLYESMIAHGIAPEQARFILPQGVYTEWVWSGSLMAWARFYNQRTDPHAQQEIQELARMTGDIIGPLFPVSWSALTGGA